MSDFVLSCESTADYPRSFFEERQIAWVPFHYNLDGVSYPDDLYASISPEAFFDKIKAGAQPTTSQVGVGDYVELWEPFLKEGKDVLHLTLSSGISGTYNSACVAAEQLRQAYPERTVRVIDSLAASAGYGLLMEYLADLRDGGMGFTELGDWAEEHKLNVNHWFFVSDLDCLKRGGRVSATSALLANALKICPVLNVDYEGKLIPRQKIRTTKKAIAELVRMMEAHAEDGLAYSGKCVLSQSNCRADADAVVAGIEEKFPQLAGKIEVNNIGTVIGSHTGPGTVALFFMGDRRVD
ncbi:fatty acid-binding protein DegV [Collinsella sp. An7]|uniref:DegV family protein n=1 Tax=Collinsella sp. An7 TaxID=1965651 RepID=UPI000B36A7E1|nr:DegV family protein [Collinsella sp. An7]OUN46951.1 fatty acid-binding protein DegV [Collinsella sp. An7]